MAETDDIISPAKSVNKALWEVQKLELKAKKGETAKVRTKSGVEYSYNYADLEEIWNKLYQPLQDNSLVVVQTPQRDVLLTRVFHIDSGEFVTSEVPLITAADSTNHMQDLGGAITYARRYALTTMFNIVTDDDDNAGGTTDLPSQKSTGPKPSVKQIKLIRDLLVARQFTPEAIEKRIADIKDIGEAKQLIDKMLNQPKKAKE